MLVRKNQKGSSFIELITSIAIISALVTTVTPVYINNLEKSKIVADEIVLNDAVNLASSMYVMKELPSDTLYYTNDATLVTSKSNIKAYGKTNENEASIVMVYKENDRFNGKWILADN